MRRGLALLGAIAGATFTAPAHAQATSPATPTTPAATAPASPASSDDSALRAELARQGAAISALQQSLAAEKDARLHPALTVSGFAQIDWVLDNQASQDQLN